MIKRTADLVNDKKIEGIANIRDESDRKWYAYCLYFEA
jgi:DNA gyrase subunit A